MDSIPSASDARFETHQGEVERHGLTNFVDLERQYESTVVGYLIKKAIEEGSYSTVISGVTVGVSSSLDSDITVILTYSYNYDLSWETITKLQELGYTVTNRRVIDWS